MPNPNPDPNPDPNERLQTLLHTSANHLGYQRWLDNFILPLLTKIGLRPSVKRRKHEWVITVKFPQR